MGAVVLGLSVTLLKGQVYGETPTTTRYSVFTGAFAMIVAFVGLICLFVSAVPSIVPMALDALIGVLLLAGGIAWAVGLKGISCDEAHGAKMYLNGLLNEGCLPSEKKGQAPACGVIGNDNGEGAFGRLNTRCKYAMSDEIMQFILFLICGILLFLGFLIMRKGKGGGRGTQARYI
jgi:predicted RND superfamily exporter protein